jgi:sporulation protein YlmC with PRC-barrel domain
MIRMLLTTTALAALLASGAMAQDATPAAPGTTQTPAPASPMDTPVDPNNAMTETTTGVRAPMVMSQGYSASEGDNLISRVLGSTVYTSTADGADNIGDINDLVVDANGDIAAVVIGVGGFLGVGEKNVAVDYKELQQTKAPDGTFRYVLATTADALTAAPEFVYEDETAAQRTSNVDAKNTQVAAPGAAAPAASNDMTANPPAAGQLDRSKMTTLDPSSLTSEELKGTAVYGVNDEKIGTIGDFVLNPDGKVDAVIVDVGGFLGLGKKPVAVGFDNLNFSADADKNRYLFINATKEQLEAQPEFNRDTYTAERDAQRMVAKP